MKETIKSVILILLVLISLILTYFVWQVPLLDENSNKKEFHPLDSHPEPAAERVITPENIYLFSGEEHFLLRPGQNGYAEVWSHLYYVLRNVIVSDGVSVESVIEPVLWKLEFPVSVPIEGMLVKDVIISQAEEEKYLYAVGEKVLKFSLKGFLLPELPLQDYTLFTVSEVTKDVFTSGIQVRDPFLIPSDLPPLAAITLSPGDISLETLLRAVFIDPTLVRKIVYEDDEIYTDGGKGLRVAPDFIELTTTYTENNPELLPPEDILTQAVDMVNLYYGWDNDYYLSHLELNNCNAYGISLRPFLDGVPLEEDRFRLDLSFTTADKTEFYFPLWQRMGEQKTKELPDYIEAVNMAAGYAKEDETLWLEEMELVYRPVFESAGVLLQPMWKIEFDTGIVYVDGGGVVEE